MIYGYFLKPCIELFLAYLSKSLKSGDLVYVILCLNP